MLRRDFIKASLAATALAALQRPADAAPPAGWREFEVTYKIAVKDADTPLRLWVPLPQDALDYQRVVDLRWRSRVVTNVWWEPASRAPIVMAAWSDPAVA